MPLRCDQVGGAARGGGQREQSCKAAPAPASGLGAQPRGRSPAGVLVGGLHWGSGRKGRAGGTRGPPGTGTGWAPQPATGTAPPVGNLKPPALIALRHISCERWKPKLKPRAKASPAVTLRGESNRMRQAWVLRATQPCRARKGGWNGQRDASRSSCTRRRAVRGRSCSAGMARPVQRQLPAQQISPSGQRSLSRAVLGSQPNGAESADGSQAPQRPQHQTRPAEGGAGHTR